MGDQKGLSSVIVTVIILVALGVVGTYYLVITQSKKSVTDTQTLEVTPRNKPISKEEFNKLNAPVWVEVNAIVTSVNLYYYKTKTLPKDLAEVFAHKDLKDIKISNNPFTNQPYIYKPREDGRGFTIIGIQSDGTEYKQEISLDN